MVEIQLTKVRLVLLLFLQFDTSLAPSFSENDHDTLGELGGSQPSPYIAVEMFGV